MFHVNTKSNILKPMIYTNTINAKYLGYKCLKMQNMFSFLPSTVFEDHQLHVYWACAEVGLKQKYRDDIALKNSP